MKLRKRIATGIAGIAFVLGSAMALPIAAEAAPLGPCDGAQRITLTKNKYTATAKNCFSTTKKVRVTVWVNQTGYVGNCVSLKPGATTSVTGRPAPTLINTVGSNWSWC